MNAAIGVAADVSPVRYSFAEKQYYMQRNPRGLPSLLGKLFVFAFTWSFGGNLRRQDDIDDDAGIMRRSYDPHATSAAMTDIATDFDNFTRELFEVEPPLGPFTSLLFIIIIIIIIFFFFINNSFK